MVSSNEDNLDEDVTLERTQVDRTSPSPAASPVRQIFGRWDRPDKFGSSDLEDAIPNARQVVSENLREFNAGLMPSNDNFLHSNNTMSSTTGLVAMKNAPLPEVSTSYMSLGNVPGVLADRSEAVPTPKLTPVFSPGLPLISPLAQPDAYFEPIGNFSELDAMSQKTGDHLQVPKAAEANFAPYSQPGPPVVSQPENESGPSTAVIAIEEPQILDVVGSPQLHAYPAPGVDLDFLQEQIDLASSALVDLPSVPLVREDEDMYGPPVQYQATGTPDVPVEISSDEADEDGTDKDSEDDGEDKIHKADVTKAPELGDHVTIDRSIPVSDLAENQNVAHTQLDASYQPLTLIEELPPPDTYQVPSASETQPMQTALDDVDYPVPSQVATLIAQATGENAVGDEEHLSRPFLDSHTPLATTLGPSQFLDGVSDSTPKGEHSSILEPNNVMGNKSRLVEEAPLTYQSPVLGITPVQDDLVRADSTENAAAFQEQMFTPDATQITPTKPNLGIRSVQALPATPEASQPTKAQVPQLTPIPEKQGDKVISTPSFQTPELRSSQRLLSKPRDSEGLFSDYFSPRTSKVMLTSQYPKPAGKLLATGQGFGSSSPSTLQDMQPTKNATYPKSERGSSPSLNLKGTTTDLSYYPPLYSLRDHFNQLVDVVGVVTRDSSPIERAKSGPKDYHTTIQLTDMSLLNNNYTSVKAQLFRPRKSALPVVHKDNILILRDFIVQTMAHEPILLSTESSAWATLRASTSESQLSVDSLETTPSGPPIELSSKDTEQAAELLQWWHSEGHTKYSTLQHQNRTEIQQNKQDIKDESLRSGIPSSPPRTTDIADRSPTRDRATIRGYPEEEISGQLYLTSRSVRQPEQTIQDEHPSNQHSSNDKAENLVANGGQLSAPAQQPSRRKAPPANIRTSIEIELPPPPRRLTRSQSALSPSQPHPSSAAGSPTSPVSVITNASARSQLSPESASIRRSSRSTRGASQHSAAPVKSPRATRRSNRRSETSESVVHELRDGTKYIDEVIAPNEEDKPATVGDLKPPEPSPKNKRRSSAAVPVTPRTRSGLRSQTNVHELRDGTKYTDDDDGEALQLEKADGEAQKPKTDVVTTTAKVANTEEQSDTRNIDDGPEDDTIYINQDDSTIAAKHQRPDKVSTNSGEASSKTIPNRRGLRNQKPVHELRDGARYVD